MNLLEVDVDEKVEVLEVDGLYQQRLSALGFVEGCEVCPLRKNGGTLLVDVKGCRYMLGSELAECILVRRL